MNHTAKACAAAAALIAGGRISRKELEGLSVYQVENIAGAAFNRMQQMDALAKKNKASARDIEAAKRRIGHAASQTAADTRERRTPLFAAFGSTVIAQIERMLNGTRQPRSERTLRPSIFRQRPQLLRRQASQFNMSQLSPTNCQTAFITMHTDERVLKLNTHT